jgi:small-conductance mechanosensitive channel/CRP-like cAMP-binding protein
LPNACDDRRLWIVQKDHINLQSAICNLQSNMDTLLRDIQLSTELIVPLALGLAAFTLIMVIGRLLRRFGTLRIYTIPFTLGAFGLAVAIGLRAAAGQPGLTIGSSLRTALLATLICCWGFVGLGLLEDMLIARWVLGSHSRVPRLAVDIGRALAFIVVILLTLSLVVGVQLSSVVISSTVLSAVIGLALQDLLKNVIAGVALQAERPFEVGHWVEINRQIGRVVEMSWRATRVITIDGNYVIYPNANLAQSELINYTLGSTVQALHVQVGVGYSHPPNLVKRVLTEAALASEDVCRDPPPSIKLIQYGDYSVTYDIKFWLYDFDRYTDKRDAVMTNAWYALNRAGIKLPFPIREVYMHQVDPLTEADQHHLHIENLVSSQRRVDLFAVLDNAELHALAEHARLRLYGRGEVLARQGEVSDTFFIIRSGRVRIDVDDDLTDKIVAVTVNRLGAGDFFGEMALLTGAPRGATVIAEEDTETVVVERADIAALLQANPELPERLGAVLARRMEMNQAALASRRPIGASAEDLSRPTLVHRIRQFFGLDGRHVTSN